MSTKTIQFRFDVGGVLTDVTSVVLRDPTSAFGIRRTDTLEIIVAANTALTHISTGLYSYTFTEPASGLNYEYWLEYVYAGNTQRLRQVLETATDGGNVVLAPAAYTQMGIDVVGCGDSVLAAFLTSHADLLWAMQARRGVALDLQYQYYVSDLIVLALDHVRMLIDKELGSYSSSDDATFNALNTSDANSSTAKTRTSSFTESSSSAQDWSRTSARSSSSSANMDASNSASRNSSSSDTSTVSQSSSGNSSRTHSGFSHAFGTVNVADGTSGEASQSYSQSLISKTKYEGQGLLGAGGGAPNMSSQYTSTSPSLNIGGVGHAGISFMVGSSSVSHKVTPSVLGRLNPSGSIDADGALGDYATKFSSSSRHGRQLTGSQTGLGSSSFSSSGTRVNNRVGSSSASSVSSMVGNSSSSMSSSSHEEQTRTAASASHAESAFNSTIVATSTGHRESTGNDLMSASGSSDRQYYSQIFDSLKQMWEDTQDIIRRLEAQMMITTRYLVDKLSVATPQATLVGQAALPISPTLIQRPGIFGGNVLGQTGVPFDRFIVR